MNLDSAGGRYYFDEAAAADAVAFFGTFLRHVKGVHAGRSFELDPWQVNRIVRPLFGWKRTEDGLRRFRVVWIEIPRKNGKTTLAAGLGLFLLFADHEPGAEIYSAAADKDQARISFSLAKQMVEGSPPLARRAEVYKDTIVVPSTHSVFRVLSADAYTKHGLNAHGIVFDEVHAQPDRELYDVLHTSTGSRTQPLEVLITTAGLYDPEHVAWQLHQYAESVESGALDDPEFLPVIYGARADEDWQDAEVWARANPGLGISVRAEYLSAEARRAAAWTSYQNTFRRLHLNQWTSQVTRWIDMEVWARNEALPVPAEEELEDRLCYVGLDLSSRRDLSVIAYLFPGEELEEPELEEGDAEPAGESEDEAAPPLRMYDLVLRVFCPAEAIEARVKRDRVPYDVWAEQGWLIATAGNVVDYRAIRRTLVEDAERFRIEEVGYDPWNATQLAVQLEEEDGFRMVEVRQGVNSMNEPSKEFERLLLSTALRVGPNPILRWAANNVAIRTDPNDNIKPDRNASVGRIDPIVASIIALSRAIAVGPRGGSVYDRRGIVRVRR